MHLKCQKRIGDDVGDIKCFYKKKKLFLGENDPPDTFYPTYYATNALKCVLKFVKYFLRRSKVNEGESNTPCPSTLEVTYSSG
jgi:hypothetical protein